VAAKRLRPDGGDQDFGFLSSDNDAETKSPEIDFGFTESNSEPPTAVVKEFNTPADFEQPDSEKGPGENAIPLETAIQPATAIQVSDAIAPSMNAASKPASLPTPKDTSPKIPTPPPGAVNSAATPGSARPASVPVSAAVPEHVKSASSTTIETPGSDTSMRNKIAGSESAEQRTTTFPDSESRKGTGSKLSAGLLGYAIALTLLLLGLLLTGRLSLTGNAVLESLPDLRPLAPNEFRKIEDGAELPKGHVLKMGESRRFGDVVVTPVKLTKEPLKFQGFLSGEINEKLTSQPVLKLWLNFESVADDYAYPPFDSGLMSNRTPPYSRDETTLANSFLTIFAPSQDSATTRKLNYLHTMDDNFVIAGQNSAKVLQPGESMTTFIAASENDNDPATDESTQFVWRIQFRKGVNVSSGNGVTTLIDVKFSGADIDKAG
jgi:hypothetical protein